MVQNAIELDKLDSASRDWLTDRAHSRGTSPEREAFVLLDDAIQERRRREELFLRADEARVRVAGPPLTAQDIENAINWGRD